MARGYDALSAYLSAREGNRQAGLQELQGAAGVQGLLARMQTEQREKQFQQEVSALGPNATAEQLAPLAMKYRKPELAVGFLTAGENRKSREAVEREQRLSREMMAKDKLAADERGEKMTHEFRMANLMNTEGRNAEIGRHNKAMEDIGRMGKAFTSAREMDRQVSGLGTALERANLPESDAVLRGVEEALTKTPSLADYISGPKSMLPDLMVSNDIATGRQAFQKLFNITLKNRSGAAVTIPEFERLKKEFATGTWKTGDQLKAGVEQARKIVSDHYRAVASGFGPQALEAYNQNLREFGGTPLLERSAAPAPTPAPAAPAGKPGRLRFDASGNLIP